MMTAMISLAMQQGNTYHDLVGDARMLKIEFYVLNAGICCDVIVKSLCDVIVSYKFGVKFFVEILCFV